MMDNDKDDDALEALFAAGRTSDAAPSPDFIARLQADAATVIAAEQKRVESPAQPQSGFAHFLRLLMPASGLAAATVAGVWIGFTYPAEDFADTLTGTTSEFDIGALLPGTTMNGFFDTGDEG